MSTTPLDPARHARRQLAALAAAIALLLFAVTLVALRWQRPHTATGGKDAGRAPTAVASPTPSGLPAQAVTWRDVAGVELPFSTVHGPRVTDHGQAAGYTHTVPGAALAAVQVLMRTSATAGPDLYRPVLNHQVIGPAVTAMAKGLDQQYQRLRDQNAAPIIDGHPIPGNNATVAGYLTTGYHDPTGYHDATGMAVVDVLLSAPTLGAGQLLDFVVTLRWSDGDWRVLAPPDGDWGTVAYRLDAAPPGMRDYHELT
jgi:hypothetical protein